MNDKQQRFIINSKKIHTKYDYSLVEYIDVDTKVKIICPIHGIFEQTPRNHLYKRNGCNACAVDRSKITNTKTNTDFIEQAIKVHGNKYDYTETKYINAHTSVVIICPIHGDFKQRPYVHVVHRSGCKKCAVRLSQDQFIEKSILVHNNKYDYSLVEYNKGNLKVNIMCLKHGVFSQKAESHLQGSGCPQCANDQTHFRSRGEEEIGEFIKSLGFDIKRSVHSVHETREIDILIPRCNIAIEFDGIYWHSELVGKDKYYHINKTNACKEKGITLLHILETEWLFKRQIVESRVKSLLKSNNRISARKCKIITLSRNEVLEFLELNHIQGNISSKINIGLLYQGNVVAIMTFGTPRYNKNVEWEMLRFCNKVNVNVVGGASRLFKYFVRHFSPKSIISYSDKRWGNGLMYTKLGFMYSHSTEPNYYYFKTNNTLLLQSRLSFQKHLLKNKLSKYNDHLTEWQNMVANGYNRIWDCGNDVFIWGNTNYTVPLMKS